MGTASWLMMMRNQSCFLSWRGLIEHHFKICCQYQNFVESSFRNLIHLHLNKSCKFYFLSPNFMNIECIYVSYRDKTSWTCSWNLVCYYRGQQMHIAVMILGLSLSLSAGVVLYKIQLSSLTCIIKNTLSDY